MTMKEIEVKALEWRETKTDDGRPQWHSDWFETITLMGSQYGKCERYWLFHAREGFATLEAAKAAAQEHHESRIRSCLLDKPEAVEVVGRRDALIERLMKALEAAETYVIDGVTTAKQNLEMNAAYPARKPRYEAELQEARDIYAECQAARRAALAAAKDKP